MQNIKFPGLTFIILATEIRRPQNWSNFTLKCQSALQNVKLIVNTVFQARGVWVRPDVRSQDGGDWGDRGRGRGPHGDHHQCVQQGAGGQHRGDEETVPEPPDIAPAVNPDASLNTFSTLNP